MDCRPSKVGRLLKSSANLSDGQRRDEKLSSGIHMLRLIRMVSDIEYEHILTLDMRSRTKFDIQAHQLCGVPEHETLKAWCDWVKRATSETSYFAFDISALHTKVILHTRRIRVDPRIITLTAAVAALNPSADSAAVTV